MGESAQDSTGEVWNLRRAVIQHPVHRGASGPVDRATLLVHKGFCQWGATVLAATLPTGQAGHNLADLAAAPCLESFVDAITSGCDPVTAVAEAGAPAGVIPLVDIVGRLLSQGSEPARLGASALGLPCCNADQAWALNRLAMLTTGDRSVNVEAVAAAREVLAAEVALYDAAAETIRRRHMTMHPSAWRPGPERRSLLQPAG